MKSLQLGKTVAYGRVSSYEQAENQHAAQQQIHRLELEEPADELLFDIESGDSKTRPNFNRMMKEIHEGKISTIIATRWDRLTRNQEVYLQLKQVLKNFDVRLKLLDQGEVDFDTASGELSADMQAIFAVHERRMLRERVLKGHAYRRKRKVAWIRAPWGYVIENEQYLLDKRPIICLLQDRPENYQTLYSEPDDSSLLLRKSRSDIAREAILLLLELQRPNHVLKQLHLKYGIETKAFVDVQAEKRGSGELTDENTHKRRKRTNLVLSDELLFWSSGKNLAEWVQNPVLRGHTAYCKWQKKGRKKPVDEWEIHYDTHSDQRLLSDAELTEIQLILKNNKRKMGAPGAKFYLTGLVYCDLCGYKMVLKRSTEYSYYGCRKSSTSCSNRTCTRVDRIDTAVIEQIFKRSQQILRELEPITAQEPAELIELRQQLAAIDQVLVINPGDTLKRARHELLQEIERVSTQMSVINLETATAQQIISHPQARDLGFWYTRTYQERELLYEKLLHKVLIRDGAVVAVELKI